MAELALVCCGVVRGEGWVVSEWGREGGRGGREGGGWRGGVLISVELALVCCGVVRGGWLV